VSDRRYKLWTWADAQGVRFLGIGKVLRGIAPWDATWRNRYRDGSAPIHVWLRDNFTEMPTPTVLGSAEPMSRREAEDLFSVTRSMLLAEDCKLLSTRELTTYKHNDFVPRPVIENETGLYFGSIRKAAEFYGVAAGTIQRRVKRQKGWRYADA
jgi:hypothetical protein